MKREMSARLGRVVAIASLVLALGFACGAGRALAAPSLPSSDPFYAYTGATPLGQIAPGTVLKQRPVQIVVNGAPAPYSAQQVLYRTTAELGQPTATVATIIRPLTAAGPTKLV
jgi:hypothetical protein